MPIIDNILVGHGTDGEFECPTTPCGLLIENSIRKNIETRGDRTWMTDITTGKSMTYVELATNIRKIASALNRRGLRANQPILVMASNHIELPVFLLGTWRAGGSFAALTINYSSDDIRDRVSMIKPKFVLTDEQRAPRVVQAVKGLDFVQQVFVIGQAEGCTSVDELLQDDGAACPENLDDVSLDDDAWILYSSGTTGVAKPVVHTQRSPNGIIKNFGANAFSGRKIMFINLMMNSSGMYLTIWTTVGHGEILTFSDQRDEDLLPAIQNYKPEALSIFPSQVAWLCRHPELDIYDTTSVRLLITGGSSVNPIFEREIYNKFTSLILLNIGYALSETNIICTNTPPLAELAKLDNRSAIERHNVGSVGKLLPFCRLKIVDNETGKILGPGEAGEICVQTPYLMKEYRNMPEETAHMLRNGWSHTGDKGYYDENENIFIIGRYKECIKYSIYHVVPSYIEKHVITHPAVEDVGVVGLPDEMEGELPMAFVVPRKGKSITAQELIEYTNERVAEEEKLRGGIRFIDKIPRNDLGKIVRPNLSKLLATLNDKDATGL